MHLSLSPLTSLLTGLLVPPPSTIHLKNTLQARNDRPSDNDNDRHYRPSGNDNDRHYRPSDNGGVVFFKIWTCFGV